MGRFLSLKFWFLSQALSLQNVIILLVLTAGMVAAAGILRFLLKKHFQNRDHFFKNLINKIIKLLAIMGVIGLGLTFCYYEGPYFLSFKFWFLVWLAVLAYWTVLVAKFALSLPKRRAQVADKRRYEKYLPKSR